MLEELTVNPDLLFTETLLPTAKVFHLQRASETLMFGDLKRSRMSQETKAQFSDAITPKVRQSRPENVHEIQYYCGLSLVRSGEFFGKTFGIFSS